MGASLWPQWMLVVSDVEKSSAFYQHVVGLESRHGGSEYDMLYHDDEFVMQLHDRDQADHHGPLFDPEVPAGNGVVIWFEVVDFADAVERVRSSAAPVVTDVHENPNAKQKEIWIRDPDGFLVVLAGPSEYRPR